jgi:uncharacterized protein YuzE
MRELKYSPDVDILIIKVRDGKPAYGNEVAPGIILHYSDKDELIEIEMLDASETIFKAVQEITNKGKISSN